MTTTQHKDIPDAQLHEPKGVAGSASGYVYVATGTGSGTWKKVGSDSLLSLSGDSGSNNKKLITNGTNGFALREDTAYGSQTITANSTAIALTAVADTTFNTPTQYTLLTGPGAPWIGGQLYGVTFTTDRLTAPVTGVYQINSWMNISAFPNASTRISIRYRINGGTFSVRKPTIKSAIANDISQLSGFEFLNLNAGDYVQIYVASDTSGNLVIGDSSSSLQLVRQTA